MINSQNYIQTERINIKIHSVHPQITKRKIKVSISFFEPFKGTEFIKYKAIRYTLGKKYRLHYKVSVFFLSGESVTAL